MLVPLTALNGGAIVALLTLAGAVADKSPLPAGWLVGASTAWALGLIRCRTRGLMRFPAAAFDQRRASCCSRASRADCLLDRSRPSEGAQRTKKVDREQKRMDAEKYGRRFMHAWWVSIGCFVLGAAFASFAVVFAG